MPTVVVLNGWYKVVSVYSKEPHDSLKVNRLFFSAASVSVIYDRNGRAWHGLAYPSPTTGGMIYARLRRIRERSKPCRCPRLRFPHKRNRSCTLGESPK